jgi:hypothetical protein
MAYWRKRSADECPCTCKRCMIAMTGYAASEDGARHSCSYTPYIAGDLHAWRLRMPESGVPRAVEHCLSLMALGEE